MVNCMYNISWGAQFNGQVKKRHDHVTIATPVEHVEMKISITCMPQ